MQTSSGVWFPKESVSTENHKAEYYLKRDIGPITQIHTFESMEMPQAWSKGQILEIVRDLAGRYFLMNL